MNELYRRWLSAVLCVAVFSFMFAVPLLAQDEEQEGPQFEEWELKEILPLLEVIRTARTEQQPSFVTHEGEREVEEPFELSTSFIKGTDGNTYVPYTLAIPLGHLEASTVAVYVHIVEHEEAAATAEVDSDDAEMLEALFEDAFYADVDPSGEPEYLSRAFTVPGGDYDLYIAVRDSTGPDADDDSREAAPVMLLSTEITVPNLWSASLETSSVLVAETVEPLQTMLTPEEQLRSPYSLSNIRIEPKHDLDFVNQDELSLMLLVYNPRLTSDGMPNITVEYNFHKAADGGAEEFFNKTTPQEFNAETLPPGFNVELGHQIVAGQSVPLSLFPSGEYRLEMIITDNESGSMVTRNVAFMVGEG